MRTGKMRTRIYFLKEVSTKNEYGELIEELVVDFSVLAEVVSERTARAVVSDGEESRLEISLRVRNDKRITTQHSVRVKDEILDIESIDDEGDKFRTSVIDAVKYL